MTLDILRIYNFLNSIPVIGNYIFWLLLSFVSPYTCTVPIAFISITKGSCKASMKLKRSIKNPFNSIHAAALINFGECVSGMAFLTSLDQDVYRGIVTELGAKYYAKARGVITAECTVSGFKEGECKVEVDLIDEKKVRVATVYATWIVSKIKSKDT